MLSITGIFGMAAYSVSKRLKELGIRVALGAQRKELLWAALGRAGGLLAIGSGTGLAVWIIRNEATVRDCVSGHPARPRRIGWSGAGDGAVGLGGDVDSGAGRTIGESLGIFARGVKSAS